MKNDCVMQYGECASSKYFVNFILKLNIETMSISE